VEVKVKKLPETILHGLLGGTGSRAAGGYIRGLARLSIGTIGMEGGNKGS